MSFLLLNIKVECQYQLMFEVGNYREFFNRKCKSEEYSVVQFTFYEEAYIPSRKALRREFKKVNNGKSLENTDNTIEVPILDNLVIVYNILVILTDAQSSLLSFPFFQYKI